jgi:hypothetical protein
MLLRYLTQFSRPWSTALLAALFVSCCTQIIAQEKTDPLSWDRNISGLFRKFCHRCHGGNELSGDVDLARDVDLRMLLDHRESWEKARLVLANSEMPPSDEKQPSEEEKELLLQFLDKTLVLDCSSAEDPGRPMMRRLNRTEYNYCVQDLTGLNMQFADGFAPDPTGYGFDNMGEVLSLSPVQIEQYHDSAKAITEAIRLSKDSSHAIYESVFGETMASEEAQTAEAKRRIESFATRAFRRPVDPVYIGKLMSIYVKARDQNESHETSQSYLVRAVLMSPQFLTRTERNRPGMTEPYAIDDFELASRLSFFLWSRSPDAELLDLAQRGQLRNLETLKRQTERMIQDQRSQALVDSFFGQWLSLRDVESHQPDQATFPEFDDSLRASMKSEVNAFLRELVQQNRSCIELIDSNFTYLNERLASHYEIPGVEGEFMRRVVLPDRRRGGLLTSAALLMSQSDPTRTNVPRRGNYIAGRILGTPPPPPPPNVPPLDSANHDGPPRSLRQLLELHRQNPTCANCHAKMDPLGFALENYDAIGRWRTSDGPFPIDASGQWIQGRAFTGPIELKDTLLEQKDAFAKTLIKNLMIYAYGRGLQGTDECIVRDSMASGKEEGYRFLTLVNAIVQSYPFLHRRNPID